MSSHHPTTTATGAHVAVSSGGEASIEDPELRLQALVCQLVDLDDDVTDVSLSRLWEILSTPNHTLTEVEALSPFLMCWSSIADLIRVDDAPSVLSITALHHVGQSSLGCHEADSLATTVTCCCFLLCCCSLQRIDARTFTTRPRRYQSLQLETLLAYRRHAWNATPRLVLDYILPATAHVQRFVFDSATLQRSSMLYTAITVQTVTDLLVADPNLESFPTAILGSYEWIYEHCWRTYYFDDDDDVSLLPVDPQQAALVRIAQAPDETWTFQSSWSDRGVAVLLARYWSEQRPMVWSVAYQWRVFFPYVDALWLVEQTQDEQQPNERDANQDHVALQLGFQLLNDLLEQTQPYSVRPSSSNITEDAIPDNPLRAMQVIANHVVAASQQQHTAGPPAPVAYQLLRRLLRVYLPYLQVQLVETLVQRCPFPGLQPKLVDLWRGFGTWSDPGAIAQVLDYCDRMSLQVLLQSNKSNDDDDIEFHIALLSLIEVAPIAEREAYRGRLERLQERTGSSRTTRTTSTTTVQKQNGWDMLSLTLERMLSSG